MGFRRADRSQRQSAGAAKLSRLSTPDVFIAAEQSIMAAGQELSRAMSDDSFLFALDRLEVQLDQAKACVEVLKHRG